SILRSCISEQNPVRQDTGRQQRVRCRPLAGSATSDIADEDPAMGSWSNGPLVQQQNAGPAHRRSGCNSPEVHSPARLNVGIRAVRKTAALEDRRFDPSRADSMTGTWEDSVPPVWETGAAWCKSTVPDSWGA